MPITVSCTCGQQLRVADQYAGQRVKCPGCGQAVTAPAAAPAAAAPATITFSCSCGMTMQAKSEYAGKTSQCPRCQAKVLIPAAGGSAPPAIQQKPSAPPAKRPAPPPPPTATTPSTPPPVSKRPAPPPPPLTGRRAAPPAFEEDDGLDFNTPSRSSGGRKARRSGSAMPWILAVGGVLLLVGLGVGGYFIFAKKGPAGGGDGGASSDPSAVILQYVPGDAQGFVSVRVADIWKNPEIQKALEGFKPMLPPGSDLNGLIEKQIGIPVADVERVVYVGVDVQREVAWVIIATNKPYDKDKILKSASFPNPKEAKAGDRTYYLIKKWPEEAALYFLNDRVFLFAPSSKAMTKAMEYLDGKGGKGPLEGALKVAAENHTVVAGINPPAEEMNKQKAKIPPEAAAFKPLLDLKTATITLDLSEVIKLAVNLHFPAEATATQAKQAIDGALAMGRLFLPQLKPQLAMMPMGKGDEIYKQLESALNEIKPEQRGDTVAVEIKVPTAQVVSQFSTGVMMFGMGGGVKRAGPGGRGPGVRPGPGGFPPPGGRRPPVRRP